MFAILNGHQFSQLFAQLVLQFLTTAHRRPSLGIGLAYIITAFIYRLPIPIQPLKSVSALALGLSPVIIITGAIWNAIAFLGLGISGVDKWVRKVFPKPVVRGIQMGLAYLLFKSAWGLVSKTPTGWESALPIAQLSIPWSLLWAHPLL